MNHVLPANPCVVLFVALMAAVSSAFSAESQDLAERLKAVDASHPRLFFKEADEAALKAKIEGDPLLKAAFDHLVAGADALQNAEPVKREKVGRRLLSVSRTCLQRVSYLSFAYRMSKNETYLKRAEKEMLAAASFEDWNPSHFLDVAEMTAALAIGYDWLYNDLAPDARVTIRDAIIEKGLKPSLAGGAWVLTTSNWNQVCHGGLVLGSLAVLEDAPQLAEQVMAPSIANVPRAMREYAPDGAYPEGPSYWAYGTTYNVLLIAALESALGSDFGLASIEGFMKTPEYYLRVTGPTGLYFNYSDCGASGGGPSPAMYWFAARANQPGLLWREKMELAELAAQKPGTGGGDRMLPFLLIWARPIGDVEPPQQLNWKGDGRTPVALLRTGWDNNATFVGFKGGSPSANHAHMDVGSFVLDMDGVRWGIDLGSQGYNGLETKGVDLWNKNQDSQRWTVFRLNNLSHNTLVVDGQLQRVKGNAPIISFSANADAPYTIVDMSSVYQGQLAQAQRGVRLLGKSMLVQDEVTTSEKAATVRWGMATNAEVAISEDHTTKLTQDGKSVSLRVLSPQGAKLTTYDMENPPRDYDEKNPNTRMIGFEVNLAPAATETLAVLVQSGAATGEMSKLEALKAWGQKN